MKASSCLPLLFLLLASSSSRAAAEVLSPDPEVEVSDITHLFMHKKIHATARSLFLSQPLSLVILLSKHNLRT